MNYAFILAVFVAKIVKSRPEQAEPVPLEGNTKPDKPLLLSCISSSLKKKNIYVVNCKDLDV